MNKRPSFPRASRCLSGVMALACMASLLACSMTPVYERPAAAVPASSWGESGASAPVSGSVSVADMGWTTYFPDERLQKLIRQALANNRDLRVAVLNIEQLRAQYQIQAADRWPALNGAVGGVRQPATTSPHDITSTYTGGLTVSAFELDLFGRVKSLTDAAAAQVLSTEAARQAVHTSLVAAVANAYYALWADRWQLALAEQTLQARVDSLKLQQLKYDNGVLNELDWRSAQSLVEAARVSRAQAQRQWQLDLNALTLLLGQAAPVDALPGVPDVSTWMTQAGDRKQPDNLWPTLSELPVGLPSDVLLKRSDLVQAEQQLIAAHANIGAARAARFPRITLTASAGVVSDSLSGLVHDGRSAWSFSPQLVLPIFDGGRVQAQVDSALIKRDMAIAQYDKAIQSAFKDVADALVTRRTYADQAAAQRAQTDAESARLRVSSLRYKAGVASQLDWLDAQRALLSSQQAWISAQLAQQQAHISVYKALGGGWQER